MLKVGQIEEIEITGYSSEGMGVCRIEGCAVFVPNAIRGERCEVKVTHVSRNSAHGKIERILKRSPHRINRACPEAKLCGGCQLHHMDYAEELSFKARKVMDALNRLGGQSLPCVPITGADGDRRSFSDELESHEGERQKPSGIGKNQVFSEAEAAVPVPPEAYGYRNKAQYPMAFNNGKPVAGFYKNRTHEVIPVQRCGILPEIFDRVRDAVLRWATKNRVSVYQEGSGQGLLRHIYVRRGADSGQVMVCLVVNGDRLPRERDLIQTLQQEIPGLRSVMLSVNPKQTNVVLGEHFRTLWGTDYIEDQLCGFTFRLSPRSFYQVNHDQAQRLYAKAVELAELHGRERVLDLYCGTGTITLALSRKAGKVIGVELVPQAIEDAKENAARNGVENVDFFCADAGEAAQRFASPGNLSEKSKQNAIPTGDSDAKREAATISAGIDVIVVDPPRKGLAPEVIEAMAVMAPRRIVYVSCDPATLARDVKLLCEQGYRLTHAEAFDLFPRTFHVETVVQLVRKNPDMTISVTVNLEDADLTAAESKATYEQIKDYVLKTYGFQVTSLQIAQTKRKLGLPIGDNYNLSKKENQVIPKC
ncbi:MAG: 23S rRNA (uracil(1939)-C(5))-methyltransferase RlmD, partial [Oscillospiraceae bacterium]|nr:23S rRNA (uracil(1939)-C(5))-methyltransferase RlmD [Oscillospiraceae bacterium]